MANGQPGGGRAEALSKVLLALVTYLGPFQDLPDFILAGALWLQYGKWTRGEQ